jgi:hypothetical protein
MLSHDPRRSDASQQITRPRAALIIAHPGHELRVHHWIERERPLVFVLTHGDGHGRASRLASTTRVLERAGARPGSVYGRWRDQDLYQALLESRHDEFLETTDEISRAIEAHAIDCIVADAEERYNPSHDVCRYVASAVAARRSAEGHATANLEFPLVGAPDTLVASSASDDAGVVVLHLNEDALARKLEAARQYPEMAEEVDRALDAFGTAAFRTECLTPVRPTPHQADAAPFYETYGETQVAAGKYTDVLRYAAHLRPLREKLEAAATRLAVADARSGR